jgi:hypothetical protein
MKARTTNYGDHVTGARSTLGERLEPYKVSAAHRRTRDRRRIRRK